MRRVPGRSLRAALTALIALTALACSSAAAPAATPDPGLVTMRIEGSSQTLLAPTVVTTQAAAFHPASEPDASRTCPGTSAAYALELATGGTWGGTFYPSFGPSGDYQVTSILGEAHPTAPTDGGYWAVWVNNAPAQIGVCQEQLSAGDQVLFFPDCYGPTCPVGFVSPAVLSLTAPTVVQSGTSFPVAVVSYPNAGGPAQALVGATVTGGGTSVATGAGGQAALTLTKPGSYVVQATAANSVRTESLVCVHNGNDGNCGTTKSQQTGGSTGTPTAGGTQVHPGGGLTPCATNGADGFCGTLDKTAPIARLQIPEGRFYAHGKGPRLLNGTVAADPSGLRSIRLRLTRLNHRVCQVFSPTKATLIDGPCRIEAAEWFTVGPPSPFSYLLKKRLPAGRYVLDVQATDNAGNVQTTQVPGRSRIVFRVG